QHMISLAVLVAGVRNDIGRQRGRGRLFVPADGFQIIAHVLLVERWLRTAGLISSTGPEARGIGREHLVGQDQLIANESELELCVGDDNASRFSVGRGATVDFESKIAQLGGERGSYLIRGRFERNVFVVAGLGFGGGREDRLWKAVAFSQASRQWNAADRGAVAIVLPTGT